MAYMVRQQARSSTNYNMFSRLRFWTCAAVVLMMLLPSATLGLRFELDDQATCFSEDLSASCLLLAKYHVLPHQHAHKISVKVYSPLGRTVHRQDRVTQGEFSMDGVASTEEGRYMACFWVADPYEDKVGVELEWRTGVAAKDWASIAKREHIEGMELELRQLEEMLQTISFEMSHLTHRALSINMDYRDTSDTLSLLSAISLFICLLVAGLQWWYLKSFFQKKKLI